MSLLQKTAKAVQAAPGAAGDARVLDIEVPNQQCRNWCWCAVTLAVRRFYAKSSEGAQCEVAGEVLSVPTACQDPEGPMSNVMHDLTDALGHYGLLAGSPLERGLSFQEIVALVDAERPIGAQILFLDSGSPHVLIIRGYRVDGGIERVLVDDPQFGESDVSLAQFAQHYRDWGEWTITYRTQPPMA